jgi:lipopolysaccharide export system protein LptA
MRLKILLFFALLSVGPRAHADSNPFSHITITSEKATGHRNHSNKNKMTIVYETNVQITLADETKISAEVLSIDLLLEKKESKQSPIEKVILKKNVLLKKENKVIRADEAQIIIPDSQCTFHGNVSIIQNKMNEKDVPFKTMCSQASFNWNDETIALEGSKSAPVLTTLELPKQKKSPKKKRT